MVRFLAVAFPLVLVELAVFTFLADVLRLAGPVTGAGAAGPGPRLPAPLVLAAWLLEATALIALFLLAAGRDRRSWIAGLAAGWCAWIFRGPLTAIAVVAAGGQPGGWGAAVAGWLFYTAVGLSLASLPRRRPRPRVPAPGDAASADLAAVE